WFALAAIAPLAALAQDAELAPAPQVDWNKIKSSAPSRLLGPAAAGGWLDTSNRSTVATTWASSIAGNKNLGMGWTGSVAGCNAGDGWEAWRNAVLARINWFRGMAGVPNGINFQSSWNQQDQQAALMMSANQTLSHTPPTNWACYTAAGAEAASKSNVCYLSGFGNVDPGCV